MRSFGIGVLCAVIGAIAAAIGASLYGDFYHVSPSDIGWGFMVVFILIPVGGLTGLACGLVGAQVRRAQGTATVGRSVSIGAGMTLAVIGGVTGVLVALAPARPQPVVITPRWIYVQYELRLPAGEALPGADSGWAVAVTTPPDYKREALPITWNDAAMIEGRAVIPASGYVYGAAPWADLITLTGKVDKMTGAVGELKFSVWLPANPTTADQDWSNWAEFTDGTAMRTRVQFRSPP